MTPHTPSFRRRALLTAIEGLPLALLLALCLVLGVMAPTFFQWDNLRNILLQTAVTGILATGMTFVLLTAGVDLSVGAIMFVCSAVGGKLIFQGAPFWPVLLFILVLAALYGLLNGLLIARFKIMAFIVTLATLYLGRGLGLWITETRAMNLPDLFYQLGASRFVGIPMPVLVLIIVVLLAYVTLHHTPLGRQIYAVGGDIEAARKAGISTRTVLVSAYVICGLCAGLAAIVALCQTPAVSPSFGKDREFAAIAAAVLGGTSLFGGKGRVFPGTLLGAVLIQTVENGLNILNTNPYLYPIITSGIIFLAVLVDSLRKLNDPSRAP